MSVQLLAILSFIVGMETALVNQPSLDEISGIVRSSDGQPLGDVWVCQTSWLCMKNSADGTFRMNPQFWDGHTLRFTRTDFRPLTKVVEEQDAKHIETLYPGDGRRAIPYCKNSQAREGSYIGGTWKILVPESVHIMVSGDNTVTNVAHGPEHKREWLTIGGGANWSRGLPQREDLTSSTILFDRDLAVEGKVVIQPRIVEQKEYAGIYGVDVKGVFPNGHYWRFVGDAFQTISYHDASPEAAEFFNSIIDSMCRRPTRSDTE